MTQSLLADGLHGYCNPIMLAHSFGGLAKRVLGTKIHHDALQASGVSTMTHARTLAERAQLRATSAQAEQLLLEFPPPKSRKPDYFFLMCLLLSG